MELIRPDKPQSHRARAVLSSEKFEAAGGSTERFGRYCASIGDQVEVQISIASLEYLERIADHHRPRELVRALPFAVANERARVQGWDFALAHGAKTQTEVDAWLRASNAMKL